MATAARNITSYRIGFTSTFKAPIAFILCSIAAPVCLIVHMTRPREPTGALTPTTGFA